MSSVAPSDPRTASPPQNSPPIEPSRILIVEDDPLARKILSRRLEKNGYRIETAEDGAQGWEKALEFRPQIILSDWMMPIMDGPELCKKIKAHPDFQTTYFILLTAKDSNEDKVTALDRGADEYLVKPCESEELLARVRAAERVVALQTSLAEKNAALQTAMKRINDELEATSEIQRALLPDKLIAVPGYEFAAYYRPSTECSGDYYDLIRLPEEKLGLVMADVSGHGAPAMVAMALTRSLVHLFGAQIQSPGALLTEINRLLFDHLPTRQFVTAFFGVLDPERGTISYSSAGHNPPLLISADRREASYLPLCEGFPLKLVAREATYEDHTIALRPGDSLFLYTDGIPEAANPDREQFGPEGLSRAVLGECGPSPGDIVRLVMERLLEFAAGEPFHDDVSILCISRDR